MIPSVVLALALLVIAAHAALLVPLRRWMRQQGGSWRLAGELAGLWALGGAVLWAVFALVDLELEQYTGLLWLWVCVTSVAVGLAGAKRQGGVPTAELGVAAVAVFELTTVLVLGRASVTHADLAAAPLRALLVAPAALGLCAYFGASAGYLLWGSGRVDLQLGYESLVGRRFLLSKASPVLSTVTTISVVGVSLGVWLVLVSLGILAGFESDLQRKIIAASAHIVLQPEAAATFSLPNDLEQRVGETPGVVAVAPFLEGEVAIASYSNYSTALLFGIDPRKSPKVLALLNELESGSLDPLVKEMHGDKGDDDDDEAEDNENSDFARPAPLANIVLGVELAKGLNVKVGDRVRMISPLLEVLTPLGPAPKSLGFRVAAIFSSKMYEYDARYVYVSLPTSRRFLEMGDTVVSGLQLKCDDPETTDRTGPRIIKALGDDASPKLEALDWKRRNQTLFSALKLERVVAFVVLVFIILVASFSIVNTLTMSVIEKRREIAILKTMGAHDVGIMKLFLVQGLLVGAFGTLMGGTAGVATMKLLERFGFWIPGDVYYIDSLPVHLESSDVALVVLAALLIVWDFAVFPALRGSELQPVEGLRDG